MEKTRLGRLLLWSALALLVLAVVQFAVAAYQQYDSPEAHEDGWHYLAWIALLLSFIGATAGVYALRRAPRQSVRDIDAELVARELGDHEGDDQFPPR